MMMQTEFRACLSTAILAACLTVQFASAQGVQSADLKTLRARYEQGLTSIHTNSVKALQDWPNAYTADLKKLEKKLQSSGDLDGLLAVRKEAERFAAEKTIPEGAVSEIPALKEVQLKWRKIPAAIETDKSKRIVSLSRSYSASLDELKKKLTMQGKVDQAVEAKDEIERVRTSAPFTAAEFDVASAGVDLKPDGGGDAKPTGAKPSAGGAEKPSSMAANLRASLVLYYSFDRDADGKVTDGSGQGCGGYWVGDPVYAAGVKGLAARFRSRDTYIVSSSERLNMNGWKEATVSLWVFLNGYTTYGHVINRGPLTAEQAGAFELALGPTYGSGVIAFRSGPDKTAAEKAAGGASLALNRWYHLTMTYDGAALRYYIDGKLEKEVSTQKRNTTIWDGPNTKLVIGNMSRIPFINWSDMFFNGLVDEVYIFNRALSGTDVNRIRDSRK